MKKICSFALLAALFACNNDDSTTETKGAQQDMSRSISQVPLSENFTRLDVDSDQTLTSISFMDSQNGIICGGYNEAVLTDDGGATWTHIDGPRDLVSFNSAFMYDERNIFAGRSHFYKVNGNAFETVGNMGDYSGIINGIHFWSPTDGFMLKGSAVVKTMDGGENWAVSLGGENWLDGLECVSPDAMFAYGGRTHLGLSAGLMFTSLDGGLTWTNQNITGPQIMSAHFIDEKVGYIVDAHNNVSKTTNSGATWTQLGSIPSTNHNTMSSILYVSDQQMFVTSYDGVLYKSANGGATWTSLYEFEEGLYEIYRTGRSLYVIGEMGLVLKN